MSDFVDGPLNKNEGIDFSKAQKLPGGGSTCDIYKATYQRRIVFVKRLKEKFRNKPLYLSAFDKEYDIGVSLNHASLPRYIEFHEDYIVMDFIDGKTLAELIQNKDPWLAKDKNIIGILRELLEVIDYLHQHNVVHCDIKPDNIMITAGNRNLMLIDLDKCYTDWLNDTSGSPSRYAVDSNKLGDKSIDFHGINMVLDTLMNVYPQLKTKQLRKLKAACLDDSVTIDDLKDILSRQRQSLTIATYNRLNRFWLIIFPLITLAVIGVFLWHINKNYDKNSSEKYFPIEKDTLVVLHQPDIPVEDMAETKERTVATPNIENKISTEIKDISTEIKDTVEFQFEDFPAGDPSTIIQRFEEITRYKEKRLYLKNKVAEVSSLEANTKNYTEEYYFSEIEKELPGLLAPINEWLNLVENVINDSSLGPRDLKDIRFITQMNYNDLAIEVANYFKKKFSKGNPVKIEMAVVASPSYKRMNDKYRELSDIMKRCAQMNN